MQRPIAPIRQGDAGKRIVALENGVGTLDKEVGPKAATWRCFLIPAIVDDSAANKVGLASPAAERILTRKSRFAGLSLDLRVI